MHVGAIIGTIMVGNVFRTIMPAQRALVAAIKEDRSPDPALPAKGLLRSRHNSATSPCQPRHLYFVRLH